VNTSLFNPYSSSSWPMRLGGPGNTNVAPVVIRTRGETPWSAPLPGLEKISSIVVAEDGCVFVSSEDMLIAVEPDGAIRWNSTSGQPFGEPMALADGSLVLSERSEHGARKLVARDQKTGEELWSIDGGGWPPLRPVAVRGAVLFKRYLPDIRAMELQCVNPGGETLRTHRLDSLEYYR
jgi:hypothetical protein